MPSVTILQISYFRIFIDAATLKVSRGGLPERVTGAISASL